MSWYKDENNNSWNLDIFTMSQAIEMSKSMINCYDCINSHSCINCTKCHMCSNIENCKNCVELTNANGSENKQNNIF